MPLLMLPTELIDTTIGHLHDLDDLHALTLTCRRVSQICLNTSSRGLYKVFKRSYKDPHQLLLAATKARQFADWVHHKQTGDHIAVVDQIFSLFDGVGTRIRFSTEALAQGHLIDRWDLLCRRILDVLPLTFKEMETVRKFELSSLPWAVDLTRLERASGGQALEGTPDSTRMAILVYEMYHGLFHYALDVFESQVGDLVSGSVNPLSSHAVPACPAQLRQGFMTLFLYKTDLFNLWWLMWVRVSIGMPFLIAGKPYPGLADARVCVEKVPLDAKWDMRRRISRAITGGDLRSPDNGLGIVAEILLKKPDVEGSECALGMWKGWEAELQLS